MLSAERIAEIKDPLAERKVDRFHLRMIHERRELRGVKMTERRVGGRIEVRIDSRCLNLAIPHIPVDVVRAERVHADETQSHKKENDENRNKALRQVFDMESLTTNDPEQ